MWKEKSFRLRVFLLIQDDFFLSLLIIKIILKVGFFFTAEASTKIILMTFTLPISFVY